MADELINLDKALSFTEDENQSIILPPELGKVDAAQQGFYLVGKILGKRSFNFEAFKNTMLNVFKPGRGLDIQLIEEGRILFHFIHILDRRRVMESRPWAFDKNLLVLRTIEADDNPLRIDLNWSDFHIHIHDLPLNRMTKEIAAFIGNQLGIFRDVDLDKGGQGWGSSLRIRVSLDITKPLYRIVKIQLAQRVQSIISFTYERLPNFCYWCG
ncbi:hypothetical protein Salat_1088100 [Sesamum alatum]|uniref:DUF4283 domain-containing protein n=1 Tax=Sesamum alatum TaxID=300844 RepID=A0AAE1YPB0_9LAMI|nr:hypothetical protein Salat_1088100 [Sesamum alatum]